MSKEQRFESLVPALKQFKVISTDYAFKRKKVATRKKDQIITQLQDNKQHVDETVEEFAERNEDLATEGYEEIPEFLKSMVIINAFLSRCNEKRASLVTFLVRLSGSCKLLIISLRCFVCSSCSYIFVILTSKVKMALHLYNGISWK